MVEGIFLNEGVLESLGTPGYKKLSDEGIGRTDPSPPVQGLGFRVYCLGFRV